MKRVGFQSRPLSPLILGAMASVAVIASHAVAYLLAVPDAHARHELLHATGHRNFILVSAVVLGLAVMVLTLHLRTSVVPGPAPGDISRAARLLLVTQAGGFLTLEFLERAFLADHSSTMLQAPVIVGVLLQVLVALAGAFSLALLARVVARIRGSSPPRRASATTTRQLVPFSIVLRSRLVEGGRSARGPPLPTHH